MGYGLGPNKALPRKPPNNPPRNGPGPKNGRLIGFRMSWIMSYIGIPPFTVHKSILYVCMTEKKDWASTVGPLETEVY